MFAYILNIAFIRKLIYPYCNYSILYQFDRTFTNTQVVTTYLITNIYSGHLKYNLILFHIYCVVWNCMMSTQSEQVSWCCKFGLLLWKNAKLMRRRKYLTCLELLLPLFVCLLLITIRIVQKPEEIPIRHYLTHQMRVYPYQDLPLG